MEVMEKNEIDGIIVVGGGGIFLEVSGSIIGVVMISGVLRMEGILFLFC